MKIEDLIVGEIYFISTYAEFYIKVKEVKDNNDYIGAENYIICDNNKTIFKGGAWNTKTESKFKYIRNTTLKEKYWFEECIKQGKVLPFNYKEPDYEIH